MVGFTGSLHGASYAAGSVEKIEKKSTLGIKRILIFSKKSRRSLTTRRIVNMNCKISGGAIQKAGVGRAVQLQVDAVGTDIIRVTS